MRQSNRPQPTERAASITPPKLATGQSYITADQLKASLDMTGETYADADMNLAVLAASRTIDNMTHRRFTLDADAQSVRYYRPTSQRFVEIDDLVQITELATGLGDGTFTTIWTQDTQYVLEPMNAPADGEPYTSIRSVRNGLRFRTDNAKTVRVTGQFGWLAVPDEIQAATSLLAAREVRRIREAPFGVLQIGLDGQLSRIANNDPDVMNLVKPYVRWLVA